MISWSVARIACIVSTIPKPNSQGFIVRFIPGSDLSAGIAFLSDCSIPCLVELHFVSVGNRGYVHMPLRPGAVRAIKINQSNQGHS
jgi:hypothetical protein